MEQKVLVKVIAVFDNLAQARRARRYFGVKDHIIVRKVRKGRTVYVLEQRAVS